MTDPRMTPTNDAPVTVEQCDREAAARERTAEYEGYGFKAESLETPTKMRRGHRDWDPLVQKHTRHRLAALASAPAGKLDRDRTARRIKELIDEGDGFWTACSGCQESVDGYVSETDYPFDPMFRCQPGGGCSECGGIGVLWDDGRGYGDITGDEEPASAPAGDGYGKWHPMLLDLVNAIHRDRGEKTQAIGIDLSYQQALAAALARPRAAVGEQSA